MCKYPFSTLFRCNTCLFGIDYVVLFSFDLTDDFVGCVYMWWFVRLHDELLNT